MKVIYILITITLALNTYAQTIEVKQDGTGDYTTIQEAVDASVDGDVVLVWPGTYYENVDLSYKDITLTSLIHTTGDSTYKYSTIINGNQTGSCISVLGQNNIQTVVVIKGFTLTNGSGREFQEDNWGGGICLLMSYGDIRHCVITNNNVHNGSGGGVSVYYGSDAVISDCFISDNRSSFSGGGIVCVKNSTLNLKKTTVCHNHALSSGGGILNVLDSYVYFDSLELCNIYENFSAIGCDILVEDYINHPFKVFVDTFTVLKPDSYFLSYVGEESFQLYNYSFNALHSTITPYDGDIYVNPNIGDNSNTGTTQDDPLQSVAMAYSKIAIDSLEQNNIYLTDGIYSDSANNEKFPLNIRPYINIVGNTMENTVFDGMYKTKLLQGNNEVSNYSFSNLHFIRGSQVDYENIANNTFIYAELYNQLENLSFDSVIFDGGICWGGRGALFIKGNNNIIISNCIFRGIIGARALNLSYYNSTWEDTIRITNCRFENNKPDTANPIYNTAGGGCRIFSNRRVVLVTNCLFDNNDANGFMCFNSQVWMNNCTFVNNSNESQLDALLVAGSDFYMYNCLMYNNYSTTIWVCYFEYDDAELYVYNSLLENGEECITLSGDATLYYDSTNIDKDPIFTGIGSNPYQIDYGSPCIDKGTLDLPPFLKIPEYDLAGNPRVVGSTIDMGCYEWNPTVGIGEQQFSQPQSNADINCSPNPATNKIRFMLDESYKTSNIQLVCTDINGRVVYNNSSQEINNTVEIDVTSWQQGIYIATVLNNDDIIGSCRFMVR